jgi:beta-lactamase regulating signal transducer with metallopeptidase domain
VSRLYAIAAAVSWELGDIHFGFPAAFAEFARAAAPVAVAAVWQGAVVAVGMAIFLRLAPRVSAAHRFIAWTVGFVLVAGLPFLPLLSQVASHTGPVSATPIVLSAAPRPWFALDSRWALAIAGFWLAAAGFRFAELAFHSIRLRKLWRSATPIADRDLALSLAASLPDGRAIEICTTHKLDRPSVIGFFAPRILIPEWLVERLTPEELEQVVLHEAEHLRRRDDWTNLLQKLCLVLFPLNPALAWMERRLCREREMACDEGVVERTRAPRAYAACLTSLAERGLQRDVERRVEALSLAAWRRRPELVHRVHSILQRKQSLHPVAARALLSVVGCGLLLGSVELARCPQVVAFVAAPKPVVIARLEPGPTLSASAPLVAPGVHAIPKKAIVPSRDLASAPMGDAPVFRAALWPQAATNNAEPRAQMIKATMPSSSAVADQDSGAQYIVLTAWEQVDTAPHPTRAIADYDTGEAGQETASKNNYPITDSPAQITVTRLVLRVFPAGLTKSSVLSSKAANAKDLRSAQLAVVPLDSGWLVFQL